MSAKNFDAAVDSLVSLLKSDAAEAPRLSAEEERRQLDAIQQEVEEEEQMTEAQEKNMSFLLLELGRKLAREPMKVKNRRLDAAVHDGSNKEIA